MSRGVLCAVVGTAESRIVQALAGPGSPAPVTRRCADLSELLACASAGLGAVAVVSAELPHLDREAVEHLRDVGVWVVGLADPRAGWSADRTASLGVDRVVDVARAEDAVPTAVAELLGSVPDGRRVGSPQAGAQTVRPSARAEVRGNVATAAPGRPGAVPTEVARSQGPSDPWGARDRSHLTPGDPVQPIPLETVSAPGTVIAVWGPTGAPGRTTVALNLAAELADHGALLVDADTYGGTVAQLLGLLDEAPGVAAAARLAATGRLDHRSLAALTPVLDGGLRVLTGISRAHRWPEVPAASLEVVWACARRLVPWTVVDCGFGIEQDELLSYDTRSPQRNAATLSALAEADVVVVVGAGDPIGLQRLVRALADVADVGVEPSRRVVLVNRVRSSASGPRPAQAVRDALERYAGVTDVQLVPDDPAACDGAVLAARTLREQAPGSPARQALLALAASFVHATRAVGAH